MRPSASSRRIVRSERTTRAILRGSSPPACRSIGAGRIRSTAMHDRGRAAELSSAVMATTRSIELRTGRPGARARRRSSSARSASSPTRSRSTCPIVVAGGARRDAHRRRRQHVHRLHRRRRLPQRRPLAPARRRGRAGAARALRAHRLHDRPVRGLRRARRAALARVAVRAARRRRRSSTPAPRRSRTRSSSRARTRSRPAVIAFEGGFHGRTLLSLTLTSKTHPYKAGLGPFAPEVYRVPFPNDYRGPSTADGARRARARVRHAGRGRDRSRRSSSSRSRARAASSSRRRSSCAGCAGSATSTGSSSSSTRCRPASAAPGRMFAIEHYGVEPDLMTVAKSIAAGLPLSGVIGKAEIMDAPGDSAIGGTYVGNPVAQAAALAVLDVFEEEGLVERAARDRRDDPRADARAGRSASPQIGDVRGLGAMLAIELVARPRRRRSRRRSSRPPSSRRPPQRGLLLLKAGIYGELHPRARPARDHRRASSTRRSTSGRRRSSAVARR